MRTLSTAVLFLPSLIGHAQWSKADSTRVVALNEQCHRIANEDPVQAISFVKEALALAQRLGFTGGEAQAHGYLGYAFTRNSQFDSADVAFARSLHLYAELGDSCNYAATLYNAGLNLQMQQQHDSALACFTRVLRLEERCDARSYRSSRLFAVGSCYDNMQRFEDALPYYREALALDSAEQDTSSVIRELIALANMNAALSHHDRAVHFYERAIALTAIKGDRYMEAYIRYNLGELAMAQNDPPRALREAQRSVDLFRSLDRRAELAHASIFLGTLHLHTGAATTAREHLLHAFHLADSLGLRDDRSAAMHHLARAFEAAGDASGALQWLKRYVAFDDTLKREEREARTAELTVRFETENKQKELDLSRAREAAATASAERLRAQRGAYIAGGVVLIAFLLLFISRYRMKRRTAEELQRVNAEVLQQKQRAEASERAKDRFLANVSHEIRTPLNAIMGFTGLLMHEHRDERTARYLGNIREAGDNLLVVINDVLDISRLEAGRLQLVKEPFELERIVRLCADILHHRAEEQGNTLTVSVDAAVPCWVSGDSARLLQVLLNLTGNALKFTQGGAVHLDVRSDGDRCVFTVRDTGIGIPPEKLQGIFERFTQVEVTDQRNHGGTGLGLAIVKELVELHGGSIAVASSLGEGTTFTVHLPLPAADAPQPPASREEQRRTMHLSGHTIVVAEDNEMNALVTTETLHRHYPHCTTEVVRTGQAALDLLAADVDGDIALVLMDVQMPEMDGLTATRRIRALPGAKARVPIIALTASVLPSDLTRCLDAGMDACVSKPFKAAELTAAIARLTGDGGVPAGVGYDVQDPRVALFHWLVPPRLKALRRALEEAQHGEVKRIVHALRPQLVERDARFAVLCDRVAHGSTDGSGPWYTDTHALITAIENALA